MSDRWDWWRVGRDSSHTPRSWQPLSEEDQAKVVVIPTSERVRLSEMRKNRNVGFDERDNDDAGRQDALEVAVKIQITGVKMTRREGLMGKGKAPMYSAEKLMPILADMVEYYGGMPTTTQVGDYAATHEGVPRIATFVKYLGLKSTWPEKLAEYLKAKSGDNGSGTSNPGALDESDGASNACEGESGAPEGGEVLEGDGTSGVQAESGTPAGVKASENDFVLTEDDVAKARNLTPELSGAVNISVKVNGQRYLFVLDFENLRPVIVENEEDENSKEV